LIFGHMRALTNRRHVPRNGFGEGRNRVVAGQRSWTWVATNIKLGIKMKQV